MAAEIPEDEPAQLVAGATVKWSKSLADYLPSDGWALNYRIVAGAVVVSKTPPANSSNTGWDVTIAAADLAAIVSETTARLFGWVSKTGEVWPVYDAPLLITPNPLTATATDIKTHAKRVVEAIEARVEGRLVAGGDMDAYTLDGRQVSKIPLKDLAALLAMYRAQVWREENPTSGSVNREANFVCPG